MKRLAIIIINYRTPYLIGDCLDSLKGQVDSKLDEVVIIDNDSGDGSDVKIEQHILERGYREWVSILRSSTNNGFSAGNNNGINSVDAKFYLLLNSDTLLKPKAIQALLAAMQLYPDAAIIGPRLESPEGKQQESCFRYRKPTDELFYAAKTGIIEKILGYRGSAYPPSNEPMRPEWISFACVLIRKEVFRRVGLMDENYFMYFEDMDYCHRVKKAGLTILHYPKACVVHIHGGSSKINNLAIARRRMPDYWYASRSHYYRKHYGWRGYLLANLCWYIGRSISIVREFLWLKKPHTYEKEWLDIWAKGKRV